MIGLSLVYASSGSRYHAVQRKTLEELLNALFALALGANEEQAFGGGAQGGGTGSEGRVPTHPSSSRAALPAGQGV
eukprot:7305309-Prymnesium_polylepis.1